MKIYGGIDLHSNNSTISLIDSNDKVLFEKRLPNDFKTIADAIRPYKRQLAGLVVESTFNWYWLVDNLMNRNIRVHLANPVAIKQYDGLKYSDDKTDAAHLARLLRLGILPEGYIYPKEDRKTRDLLRKRLFLVRQRTAHILSFQSLINRHLGKQIKSNTIKSMSEYDLRQICGKDEDLITSGKINLDAIGFLSSQIKEVEKIIEEKVSIKEEYNNLLTVPGIGKILALTIMLETGDINRFAKAGNYVSYCRLVESKHLSNDKKKGQGNRKSGNKYLSWAYVEAANHAIRYDETIRSYYQKKAAKTKRVVAIKTVAHKLARASYYIMKDNEAFKVEKAFGGK